MLRECISRACFSTGLEREREREKQQPAQVRPDGAKIKKLERTRWNCRHVLHRKIYIARYYHMWKYKQTYLCTRYYFFIYSSAVRFKEGNESIYQTHKCISVPSYKNCARNADATYMSHPSFLLIMAHFSFTLLLPFFLLSELLCLEHFLTRLHKGSYLRNNFSQFFLWRSLNISFSIKALLYLAQAFMQIYRNFFPTRFRREELNLWDNRYKHNNRDWKCILCALSQSDLFFAAN